MALQKHESQDICTMATEIMHGYILDPTQSLRTAMARRDAVALQAATTRASVIAVEGVAEADEAVLEVRYHT